MKYVHMLVRKKLHVIPQHIVYMHDFSERDTCCLLLLFTVQDILKQEPIYIHQWQWWWWLIPRTWELLGRLMVNSCTSFMAVRTDTWCAPPTALWTKVWDEDGRDAAPSFCLLLFSFAASCLSATNSQLAFLTDECQLSQSEAFCWHDWWLTTACTSCLFSWSL